MKFLKKAAALFFCLALALSVMAITAAAENTDPGFVVTLEEAAAHSDIDTVVTGKEYLPGNVAFKVMVATGGTQLVVDSIEFNLTASNSLSLAASNPVTSPITNAIIDSNSGKYIVTIPQSGTGVTVSNTAGQVATINLTLAGNAASTGTVTLTNVNVKAHSQTESFDADAQSATATIEVDPAYTVTVQNPSVGTNGVIEATPTYTNLTTVGANGVYSYTLLTTTYTPTTITTPVLDADRYYFAEYKVASSVGSWTADATFTNETLAQELAKTTTWGNVTLYAQYTPRQYDITVQKPTLVNSLIPASPSFENDSIAYKYDITGKVFASDGTTASALAEVVIPHYDFVNFTATASGGWSDTELAKGASTVTAGQYGDVTLTATYTPHVYTLTLKEPATSATTGVIDTQATAVAADTATYGYTIEGYTDASKGTQATIPNASITAYDFGDNGTYYKVVTENGNGTAHNWGAAETEITDLSISAGKFGDVTLIAQFVPTSYTATYVLGNNATLSTTPTGYDSTTNTVSYTIVDASTSDFFGTPTRPGYDFTGWTGATTEGDGKKAIGAIGESGFPTAVGENSVTSIPVGVYGDVTLTANWSIIGKFASNNYKYARTGERLVLFAVPTVTANGAYTYDGTPMIQIPTAKYASLFDSEITNYTVYAYIAAYSDGNPTNISRVAFEANQTNSASITEYTGDMTGNGSVNAGDYGNVVALLGNNDTYANADLTVLQRLKADVDDTDIATNQFGSIADVRAIMNIALGRSNG